MLYLFQLDQAISPSPERCTCRPAPPAAVAEHGMASADGQIAAPMTRRRAALAPAVTAEERVGPAPASAATAALPGPTTHAAAAAAGTKRQREDGPAGPDAEAQDGVGDELPVHVGKRAKPAHGSPERSVVRCMTCGAAAAGAAESPASSPTRGIATRSGAVPGAPPPPLSPGRLPAPAEFERRQLQELPREVRRRLLEGEPLAAAKPVTGASRCSVEAAVVHHCVGPLVR